MKKILLIYHELFANSEDEINFINCILKIKSLIECNDIIEVILPFCVWEDIREDLSGVVNEVILVNYNFDKGIHNEKTYIKAIRLNCSKETYTHIFSYSSTLSRKIVCEIAVDCGVSCVADVFSLEAVDSKFQYIRTTSENKLISRIICDKAPEIATLKIANCTYNFVGKEYNSTDTNISKVDVDFEESGIISIDVNEILNNEYRNDVVVGVGRGVKPEIIQRIKDICDARNIRLMCSRPMVEYGVFSKNNQIGQSGESIHADTYVAIGISGATQHIIGLIDCKRIIAINPDKGANIHKFANVSIPYSIEEILI